MNNYLVIGVLALCSAPLLTSGNMVNLARIHARAESGHDDVAVSSAVRPPRDISVAAGSRRHVVPAALSVAAAARPAAATRGSVGDDGAQWFDQRIDHFSPLGESLGTYKQRYFVNMTHFTPDGGMLLYVGGEAAISQSRASRGFVMRLAESFKMGVVALEHRFYGASQPFPLGVWSPTGNVTGDLSTKRLQYLTSEQALEDAARFAEWFTGEHGGGRTTQEMPWVTVGGSYPGSLSGWLRLKYPHIFRASLASSAPVRALAAFTMYDEVVAADLGKECADAVRAATAAVQADMDRNGGAGVKSDFGCPADAAVLPDVAFLYVLADTVAYAAQYHVGEAELCKEMTGAGGDPASLVAAYAGFAKRTFNQTGEQCEGWDLGHFTSTKLESTSENLRQWMWQSCTHFGFFQVAPAKDPLRSPRIDLDFHYGVCERLFPGITFSGKTLPNTVAVNERYGSTNISGTSIIFSNGNRDMWRTLSVLEDRPNQIVARVINGTAHAADLGSSHPSDPADLVAARDQIERTLGDWLAQPGGEICSGGADGPSGASPSPGTPGKNGDGKVSKTVFYAVAAGGGVALLAAIAFAAATISARRSSARGSDHTRLIDSRT